MSDLELLKKALLEREGKLRISEEENRKSRERLEQDKRALAAVFALKKSVLGHGVNNELDFADDSPAPNDLGYGFFKKAILTAIDSFQNREFTSTDVANFIETHRSDIDVETNRANISGYLKDFLGDGQIQLVKKGAGRTPSIYRKK